MAIITVESVSQEMVKPVKKRQRNPAAVAAADEGQHPKTHTLCLFDQIVNQTYVPIIFFYRSTTDDGGDNQTAGDRGSILKASLAATLHGFYPLAGRIRAAGSTVVDCNDEGALFVEARALGGSLAEFVDDYVAGEELSLLKPLVPDGFGNGDRYCPVGGIIPLAVQVTSFRCGGTAVCASVAHSAADICGISYFLRTWAASAAGGGEMSSLPPLPEFNLSAVYPPVDDLPMEIYIPAKAKRPTHARISFDFPMVEALKQEARSEQVQNPTSVEVVTALIHLTAIKAAAASSSNRASTKNLMQTMNLRGRVTPPLPESTMGNLVGYYSAVGPNESSTATLAGLVGEIRREKGTVLKKVEAADTAQLRSDTLEQMKALRARLAERRRLAPEVESSGGRVTAELLTVTSWCRFGLYEMDFGWGNPAWVVRGPWSKVNGAGLIDRNGGGGRVIEVGILLEEDEMQVFLNDEKLREVGRINPHPLDEN